MYNTKNHYRVQTHCHKIQSTLSKWNPWISTFTLWPWKWTFK